MIIILRFGLNLLGLYHLITHAVFKSLLFNKKLNKKFYFIKKLLYSILYSILGGGRD